VTRRSKYERLSATPDHHNGRVFVAWGVGPVSGTLDLAADEAIAIGDAGIALKAGAPYTAAKLAKVRDVIAEMRGCAAESKGAEQGAYLDAIEWLERALGGDPS